MQGSLSLIGRLSGPATIIGGLLWAVGGTTALNADNLGITMTGPHLLLTVGGLLTLLGLRQLASHHAHNIGTTGIAGAVLTSTGVMLIVASKNLPASMSEDTAWNVFFAGGSLVVIGSLLFGIISLRAGKTWLFGVPLLAIAVLGVSNLILMMAPPAGAETIETVVLPILIGFAWTTLGYGLWSYEPRPADRPSTVEVAVALAEGAGVAAEAADLEGSKS